MLLSNFIQRKGFGFALLILVFCLPLFAAPTKAFCYDPTKPIEEGWALPVYAVPPEGGWDTPEGRSLWKGLLTYAQEIAGTRAGIKGYELAFLKKFREDVVAIISFLEGGKGDALVKACGRDGPVLISAFGEDLTLQDEKGLMPYVFALDLPRGCVGAALGRHLTLNGQGERFAFMADPLDAYMRPIVRGFLDEVKGGNSILPFWIQEGISVDEVLREIQEARVGGVVSFLGIKHTQYLWGECRKKGLTLLASLPRWAVSPMLEGIVIADQGWVVENDPAVHSLSVKVLDATKTQVERPDMAARAYAVASWLGNALNSSEGDPAKLKEGMKKASSFPLGSQILRPDPETHRPSRRKVAVLTVCNGNLEVLSEPFLNSCLKLEP